MSSLSQFIGGGGKLRYQEFTASGTFNPSAKLLANGGQVFLDLRAGGGGGSGSNISTTVGCGGGNSRHRVPFTVSGATTVTIGAGGAAGSLGNPGSNGGASSFGALTVVGAEGGLLIRPGSGSGNEGTQGSVGFWGANSAFTAAQIIACVSTSLTANTGTGGGPSEAGKVGSCTVWWFE